jgi:hypothetical protein
VQRSIEIFAQHVLEPCHVGAAGAAAVGQASFSPILLSASPPCDRNPVQNIPVRFQG